jgi:hypothetical protein
MLWDSKAALSLWGASGAVNDYFMWVSYEYVTHLILRHEMGHNFGHDHHSRNHYTYRENRPSLWNDYKSDGHDMVGKHLLKFDLLITNCLIYIEVIIHQSFSSYYIYQHFISYSLYIFDQCSFFFFCVMFFFR